MDQRASFLWPAAFVAVLGVIVSAGIGRVQAGADFGHYLEWSKAFLSADLTQMSSPVVSPEGYPLRQHFPGTGALFALPKLVAPNIPLRLSAFLAAGVATVILWTCVGILMARTARERVDLVLLGIPLFFIGTHAGYHSTAVGTELISLALMGVLMASLHTGADEIAPFPILAFGCAAGLIISVRANLAPYVAAAALVWLSRILMKRPILRGRLAYLALLGIVPVAVGCAQIVMVNHWMTGTWTGSPYVFGDGQFRSLNLSHPQFLSVLLHPWHGLLVYHPVYAALIGTTLAGLLTGSFARDDRLAWWPFLVAAGATLILHASWYAWWMGRNTFGGRQFAIWAIVFAAPWIRRLAAERPDASTTRALYIFMGVAALWSYVLLVDGATNFLSSYELLRGWWTSLRTFLQNHWHAVALSAGAPVLWLLHRKQAWRHGPVVFLWSLLVLYLFEDNRLLAVGGDRARPWLVPTLELLTVALIPLALHQAVRSRAPLGKLGTHLWFGAQMVTVLAFCLVGASFMRLWLRTPALPATASEQCFSYRAAFDLAEVEATLLEYEGVRGFEREKERLRTFVSNASARHRTHRGPADVSQQECLSDHGVALRQWR